MGKQQDRKFVQHATRTRQAQQRERDATAHTTPTPAKATGFNLKDSSPAAGHGTPGLEERLTREQYIAFRLLEGLIRRDGRTALHTPVIRECQNAARTLLNP